MKALKPSWQAVLAVVLCLVAAILGAMSAPEMAAWAQPTATIDYPYVGTKAMMYGIVIIAAVLSMFAFAPALQALVLCVGSTAVALMLVRGITGFEGTARTPYYLLLAAAWLLGWRCVAVLSSIKSSQRWISTVLKLVVPALFGVWILVWWEAITRGAGIPFILLPPPSSVGVRIVNSLPVLWADVNQTIFRSVLIGYALGCASGFIAAILADRFVFLRRGLIPIGNMVSALPIIGVAPIMVMWFGFDWHSKAAVVVIMTFFPMLVNTVAGLAASGKNER